VTEFLGTNGMIAVSGTMNGFPFRTSLAPSGKGTHVMTVNKELQQSAGAKPGDTVALMLEVGRAPRDVTVPLDLERALKASEKARALWGDITSHAREEWVEWVESAKKPETRARRIEQVVTRLEAGTRRVYQ
jgi:uncharacterized protein YdeI (YjbR/CyaY-like superfamily)